jgi:tetratricopeptide (TPR) repeat protein
MSREAKERGEPSEYVSLTDNSVCVRCGASSGDTSDHALVGKLPLCPNCAVQVTTWPYPTWLRATLAGLLVLLGVALMHGRPYFHAGRLLYKGEALVDQKRYAQALPYLREAVRVAPQSDKAVLLTAKAALNVGDIETADKVLQGHASGHFEDGNDPEFLEVKGIWERANAAAEKANRADELAKQEGQSAEAARLMHEAAAQYPEAPGLAIMAELYDSGAAYERKDFDTFLAISQKFWQKYPSSQTAAGFASALACKYAVTGDMGFRKRAEEMLHTVEDKAKGNAEALEELEEYAPRIRYRLDTRQIISKREYDRRFCSDQKEKN